MRCKNCGSQNDDNLYICQNCGSPLYDENEPIADAKGETKVFSSPATDGAGTISSEENDKNKKQIIVIAVLAIVLIAILTGIIIAVAHGKKAEPETSASDISVSETVTETVPTTERETTEKETETETTTETTTTTTTTQQTRYFDIVLISNDGGTVTGDGRYELGKNATVTAAPSSGYSFDGWYENGSKISSSTSYTFTVTRDSTLQAVFTIDNESPTDSIDTFDDDSDL